MELVPQAEWRLLSPAEKVERLLGKSLDQMDALLDKPLEDCDASMLNAKIQVMRVVVLVSAKLGIEHRRSEDWRAYLAKAGREAAALNGLGPGSEPPKAKRAKQGSSALARKQ